jgi:dATP pyrophosphohydrolase
MRPRYDMIQCYVYRHGYGQVAEFLQLHRAPGDFMGGTWQTIYGGIREGEKAWQTALRELEEETGLKPLEFYQLDTVNSFYLHSDDCIWHLPGFVALVNAECDVRLNEEHDAFRWLPREQFLSHLIWPGERAACTELCREILDDGPSKPHLRLPV